MLNNISECMNIQHEFSLKIVRVCVCVCAQTDASYFASIHFVFIFNIERTNAVNCMKMKIVSHLMAARKLICSQIFNERANEHEQAEGHKTLHYYFRILVYFVHHVMYTFHLFIFLLKHLTHSLPIELFICLFHVPAVSHVLTVLALYQLTLITYKQWIEMRKWENGCKMLAASKQ